MKGIIVLGIVVTVAIMLWQYSRSKDIKRLSISVATFALIISLGVMGNLTRVVLPIYMAHAMLLVLSWGGLMLYMLRGRYYWWIIFSPITTILLFLILELLTGSGHEYT